MDGTRTVDERRLKWSTECSLTSTVRLLPRELACSRRQSWREVASVSATGIAGRCCLRARPRAVVVARRIGVNLARVSVGVELREKVQRHAIRKHGVVVNRVGAAE